jgi:hypothetical protein
MKSLNRNTRPKKQPKETYPFGMNGLSNVELGIIQNEPGFKKMDAQIPYKFCGAVSTDKYPVIFSTDNVNSAIGYFNLDTELYQPILDDSALAFKLGFHSDFYITGQSQRNNLGEIVVAFTDKNKVVGYLNCDNPDITQLTDLSLFPVVKTPSIKISQDTGGTLIPGAYFALLRYIKKDGTITSFVANTGVTIISGTSDAVTDKSIVLDVTGLDESYDFIQVAMVAKTGGIYQSPQLLEEMSIVGPNLRMVYTGSELTTPSTLENVLIPQAYYSRVGTMTQLNDYLYLGDLDSAPAVNMQPWVNNIKVRWKSELMNILNPDPAHTRGERRSWMHEEVVAIYIQFSRTAGGWTQWFHVPGRAPIATDTLVSSTANAQGITAKRFQVEDTIPSFDIVTKSGEMGYWENENELYPNDPSYDSSAIGGQDLRGLKVRHHRMPSLSWCKQNLYSSEANYGKNLLDLLGLQLTGIQIPTEYASEINGWRIGFGKRTLGNATVIAQGALLHAARQANYNNGAFDLTSTDNNYVSTGGNFNGARKRPSRTTDLAIGLDRTLMRFHGFDLLFNKPSVIADYISSHLKLTHNQMNVAGVGFLEDFNLGGGQNGPIVYNLDYMTVGPNPTIAPTNKRYRKLSDTTYIPNNLINGKWNNTDLESAYGGKLNAPILEDNEVFNQLAQVTEQDQFTGWCPQSETTFLTNLMRVRDNVYSPFTNQKIVQASDTLSGVQGECFGGDTFIVEYTFHTYGWWTSDNRKFNDISGNKIVRRIACECASNLYARFETPGNQYSKWYPKSSLVLHDINNYITNFNINTDPNQFGYSKDLNALNELLQDTGIFNTNDERITHHPFRIHRGGKLGRLDKTRSWRTFLPLDYYEIKKTVGPLINLEGQDDRLLIHCANALMVTQDKTKLESDVLQVTLGSADIFQFEPQEALSSKLGYAGTQHDLSCLRTPAGYFFVDSNAGEVFKYKGSLEHIGGGLYNDFLNIIRTLPTNVFQGDGITVGYDPQMKRFLFTVKRTATTKTVRYDITDADIPSLQVGDYVFMHGRVLEFLGVNNPAQSLVSCPVGLIPSIANQTFNVLVGNYPIQPIAVLNGVNVQSVILLNTLPICLLFTINPSTRELFISGDATAVNSYQLTCRATSSTGDTVDFLVTVNIVNP